MNIWRTFHIQTTTRSKNMWPASDWFCRGHLNCILTSWGRNEEVEKDHVCSFVNNMLLGKLIKIHKMGPNPGSQHPCSRDSGALWRVSTKCLLLTVPSSSLCKTRNEVEGPLRNPQTVSLYVLISEMLIIPGSHLFTAIWRRWMVCILVCPEQS